MRLNSLLFASLLGLFATILIAGCSDVFSPCVGPCHPVGRVNYSRATAPESLITNLQVAYHNREIEHYAELLAPEFLFKFQPIDANEIGTPFWTRDQDSTGTRALLTTTEVSDIRINLTYGSRDSSVNMSPPVDSLKIRIITTDLQVDQTDGFTWLVSDQQDLFFRKGRVEEGERTDHWFIYKWDDLPALASPGLSGPGATTWGNLKSLYGQ